MEYIQGEDMKDIIAYIMLALLALAFVLGGMSALKGWGQIEQVQQNIQNERIAEMNNKCTQLLGEPATYEYQSTRCGKFCTNVGYYCVSKSAAVPIFIDENGNFIKIVMETKSL